MQTQMTPTTKAVIFNPSTTGKHLLRASTFSVMLLAAGLGPWAESASAGQRRIGDFLSRQGKFCNQLDANGFVDCVASHYVEDTTSGGCFLFIPPVADYTGLSDPKAAISASFDYAGLANAKLGGSLGTTMDGSIDEVPQADGSVIVHVVLHTQNAMAFAVQGFDFNGPLLFGHRAAEILAGAEASLGSCTLKLVFHNPAPGAPLPDAEELLFCRGADLVFFYFIGQSDGALANGQPGQLQVTQTGLIATSAKANPKSRVAFDAFPAEHIIVQGTGR